MSGGPLASCPAEELRGPRLPELFDFINSATDDTSPLITTLVRRAFDGAAGLAALTAEATRPFLLAGLGHADADVRALTISQLARLLTEQPDSAQPNARLLATCGVLPLIVEKLSDASLRVAKQASGFLVSCAAAGAVEILLDHPPTAAALASASSTPDDSTVALRALEAFCAMAATGPTQFERLCGMKVLIEEPLLRIWNGDDQLLRLNALELFAVLSEQPAVSSLLFLPHMSQPILPLMSQPILPHTSQPILPHTSQPILPLMSQPIFAPHATPDFPPHTHHRTVE